MSSWAPNNLTFQRILAWIVHRAVLTILLILGISLFFAWQLRNLSFQTSIYDLVIEDLPETVQYNNFKKIFGSDEIIRVVIKAKNIFDPATFRKIEHLSDSATQIKGVHRVISLPEIKKTVDISGKWTVAEFDRKLAPVDLFQRNLISPDQKTTVLTVILSDTADREQVIQAFVKLIGQSPRELTLYQIGMPLVSKAMVTLTEKDFMRLLPITIIIIALILMCLLRTLAFLLLPLTCVLTALIWTFGFMALIEIPLSMLTIIVPVFIVAVGTAYCLHIVSEYQFCSQRAQNSAAAVMETFNRMAFPSTLAVTTTIFGLGSLFLNRIAAIQEFALFACFGMLSFLIIAFTFFPAALTIFPIPPKNKDRAHTQARVLDRFLEWIVKLNLDHQKISLPLIGLLIVFCIIGFFLIRVETNPIGFFKEDLPVSRHFHDIYQHLSGSFPMNVTVTGPQEGFFETPEHLAMIAKFQAYLVTLPGVDKTVSVADYMKLVNYASNQYNPQNYAIPKEPFLVRMVLNNFRILLGEDILQRFMKNDFSQANILLFTHLTSSREFLQTRQKIFNHAKSQLSKDMIIDVTGFGVVISASSHLLTNGQVKSLALTIAIVFIIMFILFLSSKVALITIVPNLFPIIINFGIMGWLGIKLSMFTSLIASIAIGLAVDDTIHYMVRYNREFKKDLDDKRALRETLHHIGRPIIFTTITICAGFAVLTLSSFKPTAIFGFMMMITMLSALVGDLILLPSLLQHIELVTLWDLIRLKTGKDPRQGIPLFKGLSSTQTHYILIAGTLKTVQAGDVLFFKGDPSDSMYALISGTMDVIDHPLGCGPSEISSLQRRVAGLKTGDIVGEMGLLRSAQRSATVRAVEAVELLEINWRMIRRLQWLFPPTAHKFFYNLMGIICDRLDIATQRFTETCRIDEISGLCNQTGFLDILEREYDRAKRYGLPFSVGLMQADIEPPHSCASFDADYGIIRLLGQTISSQVRKCDLVGRLQELTYAILMPHLSSQQALDVINRLKTIIDTEGFEANDLRTKMKLNFVILETGQAKSAKDLLDQGLSLLAKER